MGTAERDPIFEQIQAASSREQALRLAADSLMASLSTAMKTAGVPKSDRSIDALKDSGLDVLLARAIGRGRLTYQMVAAEIEAYRTRLAEREMTAKTLKQGIVAFDEAAQRLSIASGKNGRFQYSGRANRARDSLITFARSLHR